MAPCSNCVSAQWSRFAARNIPTTPTNTQKVFSRVYDRSLRRIAHQESITASVVLNIHTNMNGLSGPSQLTKLKLKIRITTPTISKWRTRSRTNPLTLRDVCVRWTTDTGALAHVPSFIDHLGSATVGDRASWRSSSSRAPCARTVTRGSELHQ